MCVCVHYICQHIRDICEWHCSLPNINQEFIVLSMSWKLYLFIYFFNFILKLPFPLCFLECAKFHGKLNALFITVNSNFEN